MGLLNQTQQVYYDGNDHGSYQFISLHDIITQFQIAYVGENKIISKIKRADVAFHAQRALQELSFDTFKSTKAQEIVLPASLQMILPHDYVNYTKVSWVDPTGIKRLLYPASKTSNPFSIEQETDGKYTFGLGKEMVVNKDFSQSIINEWIYSPPAGNDSIGVVDETFKFTHAPRTGWPGYPGGTVFGLSYALWQQIDVSGVSDITISASGTVATAESGASTSYMQLGITTTNPAIGWELINYFGNTIIVPATKVSPPNATNPSPNSTTSTYISRDDVFDLGYLQWDSVTEGGVATTKTEENIDVRDVDTIWILVNSHVDFTSSSGVEKSNSIDDISVTGDRINLVSANNGSSTTWENYKSATETQNNVNDYQDYQNDIYWPNEGKRYGIEPSYAQNNGSFYIDNKAGKIHFSSSVSG